MNTNLTQVVIETIEESKKVLGEGFDFAKEQTPLIIKEFLAWRFWEHTILAVLLFGVLVVCLVLARKLVKAWHGFSDLAIAPTFAAVGLVIVIPIAAIGATQHALQAIKVGISPRVYLVEFAAETIKTK